MGEQSAVVLKLLYRSPLLANLSMVGVLIGPPKVVVAPSPKSSIKMITTLGAFSGAVTMNYPAASGRGIYRLSKREPIGLPCATLYTVFQYLVL